MLYFLFILIAVPEGHSLVPSLGKCSDVRGVENFDTASYLGSWFEYANVFEPFQVNKKCVRATYLPEGDNVGVHNEDLIIT